MKTECQMVKRDTLNTLKLERGSENTNVSTYFFLFSFTYSTVSIYLFPDTHTVQNSGCYSFTHHCSLHIQQRGSVKNARGFHYKYFGKDEVRCTVQHKNSCSLVPEVRAVNFVLLFLLCSVAQISITH